MCPLNRMRSAIVGVIDKEEKRYLFNNEIFADAINKAERLKNVLQ